MSPAPPPPPEDRGSLGGTLTQATWFWGSLAAPPPSPPDRGDFGGDPYPVGVLGLRRFGDPSPQTTKFGETLTLPPQDRGGFGGEDPHPQAMRFRGGSQDSGGLGGPRQWGCTCPGMFWGTPAPGQRFAPPPQVYSQAVNRGGEVFFHVCYFFKLLFPHTPLFRGGGRPSLPLSLRFGGVGVVGASRGGEAPPKRAGSVPVPPPPRGGGAGFGGSFPLPPPAPSTPLPPLF